MVAIIHKILKIFQHGSQIVLIEMINRKKAEDYEWQIKAFSILFLAIILHGPPFILVIFFGQAKNRQDKNCQHQGYVRAIFKNRQFTASKNHQCHGKMAKCKFSICEVAKIQALVYVFVFFVDTLFWRIVGF